jgi:hypothetical protein
MPGGENRRIAPDLLKQADKGAKPGWPHYSGCACSLQAVPFRLANLAMSVLLTFVFSPKARLYIPFALTIRSIYFIRYILTVIVFLIYSLLE